MSQSFARSALSGIAACAVGLASVAPASHAEPLRAVVEDPAYRSSTNQLGDVELLQAIQDDLVTRSQNKFKATDGWRCLAVGPGPGTTSKVQVQPRLLQVGTDLWGLDLTVNVQLGRNSIRTDSIYQTLRPSPTTVEEELEDLFADQLITLIDRLNARGVKPCAPKVKARGKTTISGGVSWTATFEGETDLELIEDGSFSGRIPISYTYGPMSVEGGGVCTVSGAQQDSLDVTGQYDSGDGTLKFTRMQSPGRSGAVTATCTIQGASATASMPVPSGLSVDIAAVSDIRIALEDGAQSDVRLPPPDPNVVSELTLELSYGSSGPGVAADPNSPA